MKASANSTSEINFTGESQMFNSYSNNLSIKSHIYDLFARSPMIANVISDYVIDERGPIKLASYLYRMTERKCPMCIAIAYDMNPATCGEYNISVGVPIGLAIPVKIEYIPQTTFADKCIEYTASVSDLWEFTYENSHGSRLAHKILNSILDYRLVSVYAIIHSLSESMRYMLQMCKWVTATDVAKIARLRLSRSQADETEDESSAEVPDDMFTLPDQLADRQQGTARALTNYLPTPLGPIVIGYSNPFYSWSAVMDRWVSVQFMRKFDVYVKDAPLPNSYWVLSVMETENHSTYISYVSDREVKRKIICGISTIWRYMCGESIPLIDKFICDIPTSYMSVEDVNAKLRAELKVQLGPRITEILDISPFR